MALFFNFKGGLFSNIFDTSKTQGARPFLSFSRRPHDYNWSKHCACSTSLAENGVARSFLSGLKNVRNLILRGIRFLTFFDRGETERARPFPLFSHTPHAKQDHMGAPQMAISCS